MLRHNPYYYHPHPAAKLAADDVLSTLSVRSEWCSLFSQGKMLGVLVVEPADNTPLHACVHIINNVYYLAAYSGVVNGFMDDCSFFVPPVFDLQNPDDFYLQKDAEITDINRRISSHNPKDDVKALKKKRQSLSLELQKEIFSHFNFIDPSGTHYRNIIDIFADAKRGLPPGGSGECAAPRLLQFAYLHGLKPLYLEEFWYGFSPKNYFRIHGHSYPSCIEKCSPILKYQLNPAQAPSPVFDKCDELRIIYEDESLLVVSKPAGLLSVPAKDLALDNVESLLHARYPEVKGPMLVHRLDQGTSGLLLAAKDGTTHKLLQEQFEKRTIHKRYKAWVHGSIKCACGLINLPIVVNPDDRPRQVVDFQFGKLAVTYYEKVREEADRTLLSLYPLTGRTHQLRVHCASSLGLDAPMLGDCIYEMEDYPSITASRLMLHAEQISFLHPYRKEQIVLTDPLDAFK